VDQEATCFGIGVPGWQAACVMELNAAPGVEIEEVETPNASPLEQLPSREEGPPMPGVPQTRSAQPEEPHHGFDVR